MAYSDYGAFVYFNGRRRTDKEDVGVFDTDEGMLPSGVRIFANIDKNLRRKNNKWYNHSQHGVMGDGLLRMACYKQGFPTIYFLKDINEEPLEFGNEDVTKYLQNKEGINLESTDYIYAFDNSTTGEREYSIDFEYPEICFEYEGYKFNCISSEYSDSGRYEATMETPTGDIWKCVYDYGYGAGHTDAED